MKNLISHSFFKSKLLLVFFLIVSGGLSAQKILPDFLGSKTLYTPLQNKYNPVPKGYTPVFINHVGRHGARHLTKAVSASLAYSLLLKADSAGALTEKGKHLLDKVMKLEKVEREDFESISYEGAQEQVGIARRMYANYSNIFSQPNLNLNITVTKKIRTTQTAEAFLSGLKPLVTGSPNESWFVNDTTLRFYDFSPVYLSYEDGGDWEKSLDSLKTIYHFNQLVKDFASRIFEKSFFEKLKAKEISKFTGDIFGFSSIMYSIEKEVADHGFQWDDVDMSSFFTCNELRVMGKIDDAEDYLVKGPGINDKGIQVKIAVPLLADFIKTSDNNLKAKTKNYQFRFTHAEAIAPFAAILNLRGANESANEIQSFSNIWSPSEVMPLSANVQWIFYKKGNKYLVKILLNEREASIDGLGSRYFPYYEWKDVRKYYLNRLAEFGSHLNDNGFEYLERIK